MKNQETYKLIDGVFSAEESSEILLNVFSSKIQFHELKNFSALERTGKSDPASIKRIPQLKKSMQSITKLLNAAAKKNESIEIKAEVNIQIIKK